MVFIITSHDQISWLSHVYLWRNPCFYITWLIIDKKALENAVLNQPIELGQSMIRVIHVLSQYCIFIVGHDESEMTCFCLYDPVFWHDFQHTLW